MDTINMTNKIETIMINTITSIKINNNNTINMGEIIIINSIFNQHYFTK